MKKMPLYARKQLTPGRLELVDAIEVYAEILTNSSSAEMTKTTDERLKIILEMENARA